MSRTRTDRFERLALLDRCRSCNAPPDEWCVVSQWHSHGGRRAQELHARRGGDALVAAYWQGYDDSKADAS